YMGSGKTVVGMQLAKKLRIKFSDLDEYISCKEKVDIPTIFEKKGEIYFRKKEKKYLKELLETDVTEVISLGGGTPCYGDNMKLILQNENTVSIYLSAQPDTLADRLYPDKNKRPLICFLNSREHLLDFINKHLFERNYYYLQAQHTVATDLKTIEETVSEIYNYLKNK